MPSDTDNRSPVFNFPMLLVLTSVLCLASYHVFGLNTALGVATCSTVLAFVTLNRTAESQSEE